MGHSYDDIKTLPVVCVPLSESLPAMADHSTHEISNKAKKKRAKAKKLLATKRGGDGEEGLVELIAKKAAPASPPPESAEAAAGSSDPAAVAASACGGKHGEAGCRGLAPSLTRPQHRYNLK